MGKRKRNTMSKFYTEISKYYDFIFPTGDAQLELIKEIAGEAPKTILDIACGSGGYSMGLSEMGYHVTAIDLDFSMIKKLREKNNNIDARVMNMLNIDNLNSKYDLLFCIGNSMVHLNDKKEIFEFLKKCKNNLKSGGYIILQIVNYDRILEKNIKNLPTIKNAEVNLLFERYYEYLSKEHKIDFKTILKVDDLKLENDVLLYPIKSGELIELLEASGFLNIKKYGSFKKDEYNAMNSFPLIVVAQA